MRPNLWQKNGTGMPGRKLPKLRCGHTTALFPISAHRPHSAISPGSIAGAPLEVRAEGGVARSAAAVQVGRQLGSP
jgi:hypothetical protein